MERLIAFPGKSEYPEYAGMYMKHLKRDGSLIKQLKDNFTRVRKLVSDLDEEQLHYRYAENKWSIKEVLVHIVDDERIYAYRALAFARNEQNPLPGFDEKQYAQFSDANSRTLRNIFNEYKAVREATIALFEGFSERALLRVGKADGKSNSVRSLGYHIAGHELHHLQIIKERYLKI